MRLFVFLERLPVGDDGDMAVRFPGTAQGAFFRYKSGELENLTGDKSALVPAVSIFHHIAHFAQRQLDILHLDARFEFDRVEKHLHAERYGNRSKHDNPPE